MKQLATGADSYDIHSGAIVDLKLNGVFANYNSSGVPHLIRIYLRIGDQSKPVTNGATLTIKYELGPSTAGLKTVPHLDKTVTADGTVISYFSEEIPLLVAQDVVKVTLSSDQADDDDVGVTAYVLDVLGQDSNGRIDVGKILGTAVTLTNSQLDVNAAQSGGGTPITLAQILQKMLDALDTAVPGSPTADSINEIIKAIDNAAKILKNKAVQNKTTGAIQYYDDDGETIILTHTPSDGESAITRMPS